MKNQKIQILNDGVSEKVVSALRKIVNTEEGTANLADVNGYEIAGKTGTAQQPIEGEYSRAKINTFASVFPSSKPEYVFIVMLDTPKKSTDYVYTLRNNKGIIKGTPFNTAGWTAVEVAAKIIEKIGPILATKSLEVEENDFERSNLMIVLKKISKFLFKTQLGSGISCIIGLTPTNFLCFANNL